MRFISSLCWVKRGYGKTPTKIKLEKAELSEIFGQKNQSNGKYKNDDDDGEEVDDDDVADGVKPEQSEDATESSETTTKTDKKYNLDDYDDEDDEIRLESLHSLACFASNADDTMLALKDDGEDSDEEDLEIRATDNLIVCGTIDDDDSSLNIYVYNELENQFYIHHDILLSSMPVCLEWLDFDPTCAEQSVNYVAVGSLNPWIEIWDLDVMDSLEPDFILGTEKEIKKKSKKQKEAAKKRKEARGKSEKKAAAATIMGHRDAVLAMSFTPQNRTVLASGSADKSIILWDLSEMKQATKIKHHKSKVQTLKFHPIEYSSLLSGSCDQTVALFDCRNPSANHKTWSLKNDIEQVLWNEHKPNTFVCSDDEGFAYIYDIRMDGDKPLATTMVESAEESDESALVGLSFSSQVPNLLVTAFEEDVVKIYDVEKDSFEFIFEKKLKLGSVNAAKQSPDSPFVFSFGGTKGSEPVVWDIREVQEVRDRFYPRMNLVEEEEEAEDAETKPKINTKRLERAQKFKRLQKEYAKNAAFANTAHGVVAPSTSTSSSSPANKKTNDTKFSNSNKRFKK